MITITDNHESIFDRLNPTDFDLTDYKPLIFLVGWALDCETERLRECAERSISQLEIQVLSNETSDRDSFLAIFSSFLVEAMTVDNAKANKNAAWIVGIVTKNGWDPVPIRPILHEWTKSNETQRLQYVTWILRNCSWHDIDIHEFVPVLQDLVENEDYHIRSDAAEALSNELLRSGAEEPISHIENLEEIENIDSNYWRLSIHHRRHHARSDEPQVSKSPSSHFREHRTCAHCGASAICIWYHDDSGTGWIDRLHEYRCENCGKYTVYHYVD